MQSITYRYSPPALEAAAKLDPKTVDGDAHRRGLLEGEPLIVILDALYKYAECYRRRFNGPLADDHFLGEEWRQAAKSIRALLNGDGAIAMDKGITTDSKSNGACEDMFWKAFEMAGFKDGDL